MPILEFDKKEITTEEILENISYYLNKCNEAIKMAESNRENAFIMLKEIRSNIKKELSYYNKINFKSSDLNNYRDLLDTAYRRSSAKNSRTKNGLIENLTNVEAEFESLYFRIKP